MCGTPLTPEHTVRIRPTTILWIDDDRLLLSVCADPFERYGYRILPASDGPTGIDLARQERPDLILLDVVMFGMDGLEVCQRLRAEPVLADTPIVLLTVLDDAGRDRPRFGRDRGLVKPSGRAAPQSSKLLGRSPTRVPVRRKNCHESLECVGAILGAIPK
jgi:CheY-like chemotaxis protein